jgi:uncharacterized protein (TIGR00369 family)
MSEAGTDVVRERVVRWEDPHAGAAAVRSLSGLDAMRAIIAGDIPSPPIALLMGFRLAEADEGRVVFIAENPDESLYNPIGVVHGGFACTILDSAMGCAVQSTLPVNVGYTTTDVQIRFIRAITAATGPVRCEAKVLHAGRSTAVAEGRLVDGKGKLLAIGTTACAVIRP